MKLHFTIILIIASIGYVNSQTSVGFNVFRSPLILQGHYTDQDLVLREFKYIATTTKIEFLVNKRFRPLAKHFYPNISAGVSHVSPKSKPARIKGSELTNDDLFYIRNILFNTAGEFVNRKYLIISITPSFKMEINKKNYLDVGISYNFYTYQLPEDFSPYENTVKSLQLSLGYEYFINNHISINFNYDGLLQQKRILLHAGEYIPRYHQFGIGASYLFLNNKFILP